MKLKQSPDDFRVEERTDVAAGAEGPFAFYRLEKRGWTTPDALQAVRRRWNVDHRRLSYGGLKDRHAHTIQYLTIFQGPRRNFSQQGIFLHYLGQVPNPYSSTDIRANAFTLALRDMPAAQLAGAERALEEVKRVGVPNYFDDQRFGSVTAGRSFVAREMVLGNYEEALKLALAAPYEHDRSAAKQEKAILNSCWGNWKACKERLPRGHARSLVDYLVSHPTDFGGALARLRPELRGLYLSAYQSHLWNRMLARWLETHLTPEQRATIELRLGPVPVPRAMPDPLLAEWKELTLPLPSARLHFDESGPWAGVVQSVMDAEGLKLEQIKLKGFRKPFFSKGDRAAVIWPEGLEYHAEPDERRAGRSKLVLSFELPRGAYATMLVKRITASK